MPKSLRSREHRALIAVLVGARKAARITQEQLADSIGWSQSEVSRVEQGDRRLDCIEFVRWAKALREDPVRLFERFVSY